MNTFLFDLDGTLLPMDQDAFMEAYFHSLTQKMLPYGVEPKKLTQAVFMGIKAMIDNDGSMTNEQRFWNTFTGREGEMMLSLKPVFEDYYRNEFLTAKKATACRSESKSCIRLLKEKGYTVVLATNPLFPRIATLNRIAWAGLSETDFDLITTYENSSYCKPNRGYYREILKKIGKEGSDCIMVGNDIQDDMCVEELGIETYLLTDCLINRAAVDISCYRQGALPELLNYIRSLPALCETMAALPSLG